MFLVLENLRRRIQTATGCLPRRTLQGLWRMHSGQTATGHSSLQYGSLSHLVFRWMESSKCIWIFFKLNSSLLVFFFCVCSSWNVDVEWIFILVFGMFVFFLNVKMYKFSVPNRVVEGRKPGRWRAVIILGKLCRIIAAIQPEDPSTARVATLIHVQRSLPFRRKHTSGKRPHGLR